MQLNKSELVQFIEKASKELRNTSSGECLEKLHSIKVHQLGIPVLVSSSLLRSHQCGQIDLAIFKTGKLIVFEVKSSPELISKKQLHRLKRSTTFVSSAFDSEASLLIIK